jgi:tetratricopeptide (TPR) repeat protein
MNRKFLIWAAALLIAAAGCSPKTSEQVAEEKPQTEKPQPPKEEEGLSPCQKFRDAPYPDQVETNYVIYRDFLRAGEWDKAFELWKEVYNVAPAADGRRNTVYADGIRFYEYYYSQTQDTALQSAYVDTIFSIYDEIDRCYPEGGYVKARKAFDLFYKYRERASKEEIYEMFKAAIDEDGLDVPDFVVNPFASLLVTLYDQGKMDQEEAYKYQDLLRRRIEKGLEECSGTGCERWEIIQEYAPVRLEYFETVEGFYPCEYYIDKYYQDFLDNPQDCDVVRTVYSRLQWGQCPKANEKFQEVIRVGKERCRPEAGPADSAYTALRNANYNEAIQAFQQAIGEEDEVEKKADYALLIAKIYEVHLRNFPKAREWALKAAEIRSNWGEPYMLIGRLYASSGPLCGPGRGWDSQVVTWPAIDMWKKAKRVDPNVRAEANKLIAQYSQFMPNREDVFIRNLKAGQSFFVGCWIQRSTTIRTSD